MVINDGEANKIKNNWKQNKEIEKKKQEKIKKKMYLKMWERNNRVRCNREGIIVRFNFNLNCYLEKKSLSCIWSFQTQIDR